MTDAKKETGSSVIGTIGKLFVRGTEEIGGTAIGTFLGKVLSEAVSTKFLEHRQEQISALFFGPNGKEERAFAQALFSALPEAAKKSELDPEEVIGRILDMLSSIKETELQDAFRQKILQFDDKNEPNPSKTAEVLLGIYKVGLFSDKDRFDEFRKIYNLTRADLPFDPEETCQKIEGELNRLNNEPTRLSFWQQFNFLSMTHPSLVKKHPSPPAPTGSLRERFQRARAEFNRRSNI